MNNPLMLQKLKSEYTTLRSNYEQMMLSEDGKEQFLLHKKVAIDILNAYRNIIRRFYNQRVRAYDFEDAIKLNDLYELCWVKKPDLFTFLHKENFIKQYEAVLIAMQDILWKET